MIRAGLVPALLALLVFLGAVLFVAQRVPEAVDTDILSLLPADAHDPVLADALQRASGVASDRVAFVIEGGTPSLRAQAATRLTDLLEETGLFRPSSQDAEELWRWLHTHRTELLCSADKARLADGRGDEMAADALRQWYAPTGIAASRLLQTDPLLLTSRLLGCLVPAGMRGMADGDGSVVSGSITASVFRLDVQDRIGEALSRWRAEYPSKGLRLSRAGALFHATYGAGEARTEISIIGSVTTAAVLLLYWLMFRSFRAPLIAVGMVIYSLSIGLAVTIAVFGHIHAMALVFGAALTGMVIDYTTYYLVTGLGDAAPSRARRRAAIWTPLSLGMLTSVGAFAALLVFPIQAFQQIAVLGGVGLVSAWVATFLLTPLLEGRRVRTGPGARWADRYPGRFLASVPSARLVSIAMAGLAILAIAGYAQGHVLDNVRQFQAPSAKLTAEEARVRDVTGFRSSGLFFLVRGDSRDDVARHEEDLLREMARRGKMQDVTWAASRIAPSQARRKDNRELIEKRLIEPYLEPTLRKLGGGNLHAYDAEEEGAAMPGFIASLRGHTGDVFWSIVPVGGAVPKGLETGEYWQLVDPAARYSSLMREYRQHATYGLIASILATGILLLLAYRRLDALRIMLPMVTAVLVTPAIGMLLGQPFSFFSAMGLFLVVGAGVDYAIFQWESPREEGRWTRVGIALAALMTCISVGLLGLSSVLPVRSFGITVAIGVFLSLTLSPIVRKRASKV